MKTKLTFILAFAFMAINGFAQITLTANDVALIGQSMTQVNDTLPAASIVAGPGGQNQTWDFSALHDHQSYSFATVAPNATPHSALFPTADVVAIENDSAYAYFEKDNDGLRMLGIYGSFTTEEGSIEVAVKSTPAMSVLRFPTTHNDGFTEQYKRVFEFNGAEAGLPVDSFRVVSTVQRTVLYDSYGTMTTPAGTFQVMRVKESELSIDTTYILFLGQWTELPGEPIMDITYNFWTKQGGIGFPVASIQADESGNTVSANWMRDFSTSPAHEPEQAVAFELFPNPCTDQLSFDLLDGFDGSVEVYDFMGKRVANAALEGHFGTLDTSDLSAGMYVAVLKSAGNGRVVGTKRFEVAR